MNFPDCLSNLKRIVEVDGAIIGDLQNIGAGETITFFEKLNNGDLLIVYSGFSGENNYTSSFGIVNTSAPFLIPTFKGNIVLKVTGEKTCKILKIDNSIRLIHKAKIFDSKQTE